jgi:5,10-methylenetetrahydrofolate reductase
MVAEGGTSVARPEEERKEGVASVATQIRQLVRSSLTRDDGLHFAKINNTQAIQALQGYAVLL